MTAIISIEEHVGGTKYKFTFRYQDTAIGIAEEFIPKLFSEFMQESDGLTRSHNGTGLGLAITERMVTAIGGTIIVSSMKGCRSCFAVVLPEKMLRSRRPPTTTIYFTGRAFDLWAFWIRVNFRRQSWSHLFETFHKTRTLEILWYNKNKGTDASIECVGALSSSFNSGVNPVPTGEKRPIISAVPIPFATIRRLLMPNL